MDHAASGRPMRSAKKHKAKTEWLGLAPKYCQKGAAESYKRGKCDTSALLSLPLDQKWSVAAIVDIGF
jgi:hypothetical protein